MRLDIRWEPLMKKKQWGSMCGKKEEADNEKKKKKKNQRISFLQQIEIVKIFEGVSPHAGDTVGIE